MVQLTPILPAWDTSIDRRNALAHSSTRVRGLEGELVALVSALLVWRLTASIIATAAGLSAPLFTLFFCRIRPSDGLRVLIHFRRMTHTIYACRAVSMGYSDAVDDIG